MKNVGSLAIGLQTGLPVLLWGPPGSGKCLGRGTPVLMLDGTIKLVEDVLPGDRLMGPDSTARAVLSTTVGTGLLYKVIPTKGDSFVCNDDHVLSLRWNTNRGRRKKGDIINIPVKEYVGEGNDFKWHAKLYRTGVDFPYQRVGIDPYVLGIWLGDGTASKPQITTMDQEVVDALAAYAKETGLEIWEAAPAGRATTYAIGYRGHGRRGIPRSERSPFLNLLRGYGLLGNKHIPQVYKANSRDIRMQLLAGIVDADGYADRGCYSLTFKGEVLANDVAFLARSLGFAAYVRSVIKGIKSTGFSGTYFNVSISGDTSVLPVRIPRRKNAPRLINKDATNVGFSVKEVGVGDYYGFELDGDGLFLLGDFTVTHNTSAIYAIAEAVNRHAEVLIASTREPSDFSGLPIPQRSAGELEDIAKMIAAMMHPERELAATRYTTGTEYVSRVPEVVQAPLAWARRLSKQAGILFLDELSCCVAGTPIIMADGRHVPIQDIRLGDQVRSCDIGTGRLVDREVVALIRKKNKGVVRVVTEYGNIECTPEHEIYTNRGWVPAGRLGRGDRLRYVPPVSALGQADSDHPQQKGAWDVVGRAEEVASGRQVQMREDDRGTVRVRKEARFALGGLSQGVIAGRECGHSGQEYGDLHGSHNPGTEKGTLSRQWVHIAGKAPRVVEWITVEEIVQVGGLQDVYDLTVDDTHNYFANGILVHNCVPPAVSAALLRVVLDKVVGELALHPDTWMVAAANPPEQAAGGWDLSMPLANRFIHLQWNADADIWCKGMISGFTQPRIPLLPDDWQNGIPRFRALVAAYIKAQPAKLLVVPKVESESGKAWPSPRSWTMVATALAACHAIGAGIDTQAELVAGCIGDGMALEFIGWVKDMDLPDPEELLKDANLIKPILKEGRGDKIHAVLTAVAAAVVQNLTDERWMQSWEVLELANQKAPDIATAAARIVAEKHPKDIKKWPVHKIKSFFDLLVQAGVIDPKSMK